ncbi:uncharacterized protein LOC141720703 [Apium graveolens]|uniref:uncharacterized protein LOC141720703 n=1 Tax=Apium graveolens TaxID=4045 RepID=UPI003D7B12FA
MAILKEKTLEVQSEELQTNGNSDSEEPGEDLEQDCEEEPEEDLEVEFEESQEEQTEDELEEGSDVESKDDPEEDPEEETEEDFETELEENPEEQTDEELVEGSEVELEDDQEEDSSEDQAEILATERAIPSKSCNEIVIAEQLIKHEGKDPSAKCMFKPNLESETKSANQISSWGKERIVVNTTVKPSLPQNCSLEKNCEYDKAVKQADTSQHSVPRRLETVVCDTSSGQQTNSGKRRRSRWDQDRDDDKKTVLEDIEEKKRKSRWDTDDSKLRSQEPQLELEVQALKCRFSEISCILYSRAETNVGKKFRKKLMKEHRKVLSLLEKRNAIFWKELYVPVKEYPTYNFFGLIIGPKGNTQKRMEMKTGAKIRLRSKGSLKTANKYDADLRVYIEASSQKSLDAAVCMVEKLLIPVEEGMNDHKRAQLQELSNLKAAGIINACTVCKETGHSHFACPQKSSTLKAACDTCGSFSHPTSGCPLTPLKLKNLSSREISAAKLYVGSLPQTVDDGCLRELFSPFGTITESSVIIDQKTGKSRGYGFVGFDTSIAASLAILHMRGYQMDGHSLVVQIAGTPVYHIGKPVAVPVGTSCHALPHYMLPTVQVSVFGEGSGFPSSLNLEYNQFSQTKAPVSSGSTSAYTSTGFVSMPTESRNAVSSTSFVSQFTGNPDYPGLVSASNEPRTGFPSVSLVSSFTESRSVYPSTSLVSKFPGDPDYHRVVSKSRNTILSAGNESGLESGMSSASLVSMFLGDPDYPGSGFQSYFM